MIIPTTGLSFRSPSHRLHNGCGSGAGGENTATTVPMYSPSTSTTRTKPPGCPVRSLTVCHSRSEEHTSELQSQSNLVCRLLLEKKKKKKRHTTTTKLTLFTTTNSSSDRTTSTPSTTEAP